MLLDSVIVPYISSEGNASIAGVETEQRHWTTHEATVGS